MSAISLYIRLVNLFTYVANRDMMCHFLILCGIIKIDPKANNNNNNNLKKKKMVDPMHLN